MTTPHLQVRDLAVHYPVRRGVLRRQVGAVRAVDGVDFDIPRGTTFGLVGESGCGKSSLARAILRLQEPTAGSLLFRPGAGDPAIDLRQQDAKAMRALRRDLQIVFQDPYSALNPRLRVGMILAEPLRAMEGVRGAASRARVAEVLEQVGLAPEVAHRFPHAFSGGQRQRVAIARALITRPGFLVLDEPVSALDVSVRAQILNLLADMQRRLGLTYLFVSHDLSVVRHFCDQIAVMYLGRIVERGPAAQLFAAPRHPYTRLLLAAVPLPQPGRRRVAGPRLQGDPPSPLDLPPGCAFQGRCPAVSARCRTERPLLRETGGHAVACHNAA